jgi:hypothetical protein
MCLCAVLIAALGFVIGVLFFPMIVHLRLRRNADYDNSNMLNTYKLFWVLTMRRIMLSKLQDEYGNRPLAFVANDETVNSPRVR